MRDIAVIIVAAGASSRMGEGVPKPYRRLRGKAVLRHSVELFMAHPAIAQVRVVINPQHRSHYDAAMAGLSMAQPVAGGATRQQSVLNGLQAVAGCTQVLIHDAARPMVDAALISRVIEGLKTHQAVIPAMAVTDTIKRVADGLVVETPDRAALMAVQTPQGFDYAAICAAHKAVVSDTLTDDAAVAEAAGIPVAIVQGSPQNVKLTTAQDWNAMQMPVTKVGMGTDVHALYEDAQRPLMMCGIEIDSPLALKAHSDGDVGLHAVTDALLGALGLGDIGQHFPPTDAKWKDKDSAHFIEHVVELMDKQGAQLVHLDITIICEQPKLSPHRGAMRARLAELLQVNLSVISVKATTTEGLGFTGRGEGIAAQAVATITV